jgi:hypothetical protein
VVRSIPPRSAGDTLWLHDNRCHLGTQGLGQLLVVLSWSCNLLAMVCCSTWPLNNHETHTLAPSLLLQQLLQPPPTCQLGAGDACAAA